MNLLTWNVAGRKDKQPEQVSRVLAVDVDVVALQEVTATTLPLWRAALEPEGYTVIDSFSLSATPDALTGRRKYGEIIASRLPIRALPPTDFEIPWPERLLSGRIETPAGPVEIHNVHLPAGVSDKGETRFTKIETFEGIAARLGRPSEGAHRLLCGDFNTPKVEAQDGTLTYWGSRRQQVAEESVLKGLAAFDLADAFLAVHGHGAGGYSFQSRRKDKIWRRRYDHVFASGSLRPVVADFLTGWLDEGISDHAPLMISFDPEAITFG